MREITEKIRLQHAIRHLEEAEHDLRMALNNMDATTSSASAVATMVDRIAQTVDTLDGIREAL